jgi:hypothetical protein
MKVKPKEVLVNLPVALLFDEPWEIASFAANINAILHGKVRLKVEELGTLGGRCVGLFYLQRNIESQQIHDEFVRLIEEEEIEAAGGITEPEPEWIDDAHPRDEDNYAHALCDDCDDVMLHMRGEDHCRCGGEMVNGKCKLLGKIKKSNA